MSCRDNRCLTDLNRPSRNVVDDDEHSSDAIPDEDELSEESNEEESEEDESDEDGSDEDALEEDVSNDEVSDDASSDDDYDAY